MNRTELLQTHALADEFTRLRRELEARSPAPRHIVVLSANSGAGVSTVAAQLALALGQGQTNGHVLLVDAHLRGGVDHQPTPLTPSGSGLWDWDLQSELQSSPLTGQPGVHVLGAGQAPVDRQSAAPVQGRLLAALAQVRQRHVWSVWDLPPVLTHGDGLDLAAAADGALIVVEMDQTRLDALRYVRLAMERRHATVLGVVLNRCGRWWPRSKRRQAS